MVGLREKVRRGQRVTLTNRFPLECYKRGSMSGRSTSLIVSSVLALLCAVQARAAVIIMTPEVLHDLSNGGTVTINNAVYQTVDQQPTGSGVIHSFVRIGAANQGVVEGYNTDGRPLQFDEKESATFT